MDSRGLIDKLQSEIDSLQSQKSVIMGELNENNTISATKWMALNSRLHEIKRELGPKYRNIRDLRENRLSALMAKKGYEFLYMKG